MRKRILVIDDDEDIRKLFQMTLNDSEYRVDAVESGKEGLQRLKGSKYDLVYLDLMMSGMDGIETLREIRKIDDQVPVYIITGFQNAFLEQLKSVQKEGLIFDLMEKPIGSNTIINITKGVLEGPQIIITYEGKYEFILFVSSQTDRSEKIVDNLRMSLDGKLEGRYSLEIVYISENPEPAYKNDILATPTLLKTSPPPEKRFIGDFSKSQFVNLL